MRTKFQPSVGFSVANFFAQLKFARGHDVCVSTAFFDVVEIDVAFFIFFLSWNAVWRAKYSRRLSPRDAKIRFAISARMLFRELQHRTNLGRFYFHIG